MATKPPTADEQTPSKARKLTADNLVDTLKSFGLCCAAVFIHRMSGIEAEKLYNAMIDLLEILGWSAPPAAAVLVRQFFRGDR